MKLKRLQKIATMLNNLQSNICVRVHSSIELQELNDFHMADWRCGTAGCAIGWAASDSWFMARGLHLSEGPDPIPYYKEYQNWDAVKEFFDISMEQALYLFYDGSYDMETDDISPAVVAERVQDFVDAYTKSENLKKTVKANMARLPGWMQDLTGRR